MKPGFAPGATGELALRVTPDVAIALGSPPYDSAGATARAASPATVFATPYMIQLMEHAARKAVEPYLEPGEETVGAEVNIRHLAPTPLGQTVRAIARVTAVEGRAIRYDVEAFDETQKIGEGTHVRYAISLERFAKKLDAGRTPPPGKRADFDPARYEAVSYRAENGIGWLTLNRPNALNALSVRMVEEIEDLQARLAGDTSVRVLVLTGAGRGFCAGDDVKELATLSPEEAEVLSFRQARMFGTFAEMPQVTIAAVNGPAFGAGCVFAVSCDLRVASHAASFGMPEVRLGWAPGYGNMQVVAAVGFARAMEMTLTGEPISAQEAHRIGLASKVVPQNALIATATDYARAPPRPAARRTARDETASLGRSPTHPARGVRERHGGVHPLLPYRRCP